MFSDVVRLKAQKYLLLAGALGTLVVTPWFNLDPINVPKLLVIGVCSFAAMGILLPNIKVFWSKQYRVFTILGALFVLQMLISFVASSAPWSQQFFGTFGRNTGFLAYMSLVFLFLVGVTTSTHFTLPRLMYALLGAGIFNAFYGIVQWAGADPIEWQNPYNSILGTLGNPNFASSFLGMSSIVAFALFFDSSKTLLVRGTSVIYSLTALFLAYESDSIQGVLVAGVGLVIVVFGYLKNAVLRAAFVFATVVAAIFAVLGTLQIGPLTKILYEASVTYRGDYWRAGLNMTSDRPWTGVGLDSYGDYYRSARTVEATLRRGPDVTSNSAHNVFLDISSTGGLPLLAIYVVIVVLAIRSAMRLIRNSTQHRWAVLAAIGAWAAYIAQSIISINQLGLAVWGWILPGVIIGVDLNREAAKTIREKNKRKRVDVPASSYLTGVALGIVGLVLSVVPVVKDYSVKTALQSGDQTKIQKAALSSPVTNYYLIFISRTYRESKLNQQALQLTSKAVENNPRDFNAWQEFTAIQETDLAMRAEALKRMRELDPNNPNIPAQ